MECPRCFYIDNRLGVGRPKGPSFTLNVAVDALLKKEFDIHRMNGTKHPLCDVYGVDAVPYNHEDLNNWRENFVGIQHSHKGTGLLVTGAVDDIWKDKKGNLMVVDYKATSKEGKIDSLEDTKWQNQYKRQMEVYQWLLRQRGFPVSVTGYFVYVNGKKDKKAFDGKLEFDVTLIAYNGDDGWIENTLWDIKKCLDASELHKPGESCEYCAYRKFALEVQSPFAKKNTASPEKKIVKKMLAVEQKNEEDFTHTLFDS